MTVMIPAWVDGILTPVEKLDAHLRGLRHKAISVFLICGDEMLLQRRALPKYHSPGLWANACCTHPNWGEDSKTCAERRLNDELGLSGISPDFSCQIEYRADVGNDMIEHEVVEVFVHQHANRPTLRPNPDEVMDTVWMPVTEVLKDVSTRPERYTAWMSIYMREHAARILGAEA